MHKKCLKNFFNVNFFCFQKKPKNWIKHKMTKETTPFKKSVYKYEEPWTVYSVSWNNFNSNRPMIACTSFVDDYINYVNILQYDPESDSINKIAECEQPYPPTKVKFMPVAKDSTKEPDLLITSGNNLRLFRLKDNSLQLEKSLQTPNDAGTGDNVSPSTSFDWCVTKPSCVVSCSIDKTCSVWDLERGMLMNKIVAHEKEVFDIAFSNSPFVFATVGADGSLRSFDIRNLGQSTIMFESQGLVPLLRLNWNMVNTDLIATICMDSNDIIIIDSRKPSTPYAELKVHKNSVNAVEWSPVEGNRLCSGSDDHNALIWDIEPLKSHEKPIILQYEAENEVNNLSWSKSHPNMICASVGKNVEILKV